MSQPISQTSSSLTRAYDSFQGDAALAEALHLAALQDYAALQGVQHEIVVQGLAVPQITRSLGSSPVFFPDFAMPAA